MIALAIGTICTYANITYFNFKGFPDNSRFRIDEMVYMSNKGGEKYGVEGYPIFEDTKVIFKSKEKRPVYQLTLNKELFKCN